MTLVRYRRRVWQQLQTLPSDLRRAIVATIDAVQNDEVVYRFRDTTRVFYKPVVGQPDWYVLLREEDDGSFSFVRIRHSTWEHSG